MKGSNLNTTIMSLITALMFMGIGMIILAQIGGVGYGLYLWGSVGLELGAAAWSGFVLWMKMIGTGILSILASVGIAAYMDYRGAK